jgi:hypothetical protein
LATFLFSVPFPLMVFLLIPVAYAAMSVSDRLIRSQYASYREDWEKDGKPWGPYWRLPGSGTLEQQWQFRRIGYVLASRERLYSWLFKTPDWMRQDQEALRLIFRLRILTLAFTLGGVGAFCAFIGGVVVTVIADLS